MKEFFFVASSVFLTRLILDLFHDCNAFVFKKRPNERDREREIKRSRDRERGEEIERKRKRD